MARRYDFDRRPLGTPTPQTPTQTTPTTTTPRTVADALEQKGSSGTITETTPTAPPPVVNPYTQYENNPTDNGGMGGSGLPATPPPPPVSYTPPTTPRVKWMNGKRFTYNVTTQRWEEAGGNVTVGGNFTSNAPAQSRNTLAPATAASAFDNGYRGPTGGPKYGATQNYYGKRYRFEGSQKGWTSRDGGMFSVLPANFDFFPPEAEVAALQPSQFNEKIMEWGTATDARSKQKLALLVRRMNPNGAQTGNA